MPSRSTCWGAEGRLGVRSIQPGSLAPAVELAWIWTSLIVTKMLVKAPPVLEAQVGGSLRLTLTVAGWETVLLLLPPLPHPASRSPKTKAVRSNPAANMERGYILASEKIVIQGYSLHAPCQPPATME